MHPAAGLGGVFLGEKIDKNFFSKREYMKKDLVCQWNVDQKYGVHCQSLITGNYASTG
jgi:hypothetical protein